MDDFVHRALVVAAYTAVTAMTGRRPCSQLHITARTGSAARRRGRCARGSNMVEDAIEEYEFWGLTCA